MLSSITPIGERGRHKQYPATASWFAVGAVVGGAALGLGMAALAAVYGAIGVSKTVTCVAAAAVALTGASSDAGVGPRVPIHRRQVNERWMDTYRSWAYGLGFGLQIGCGVATYIATAALYVLIVFGVASGAPLLACVGGAVFGLVRGGSVLLGRNVTTPDRLLSLHRRLARWDTPSRGIAVAAQLAASITALAVVSPLAVALVAGGALVAAAAVARLRRKARPPLRASGSASIPGG
jgi:hypothetical protein